MSLRKFFSIMTSIANYERELISERVRSGLENAKRKGIVLGRKTNLTPEVEEKIIQLKKEGVGYNTLAKRLSVSVKTIRKVYYHLNKNKIQGKMKDYYNSNKNKMKGQKIK